MTSPTSVSSTAPRGSSGTIVAACRILDLNGGFLAAGTARVERCDERTETTVQVRPPAGLLVLAIFGRGERRFVLELPGADAEPAELVGSAWLAGGGRICRFHSAPRINR